MNQPLKTLAEDIASPPLLSPRAQSFPLITSPCPD
jgi:hypothetical protein